MDNSRKRLYDQKAVALIRIEPGYQLMGNNDCFATVMIPAAAFSLARQMSLYPTASLSLEQC
ncbi:hypothetical protein D3C74_163790 [compost metagenome]